MSFSDPNTNTNNNKEQNEEASYNFVNRRQGEGLGLVQLLLIIITIFIVVVALGLFGYSFYLKSENTKLEQRLDTSKETLKKLNLEEIRSLSSRLSLANDLMIKHQNIGSLLHKMEDSAEDNLSYNSLSLSFDETKKKYSLSLQGNAKNYETLIRQIDALKKDYTDYFSNVEVRSLTNRSNSVDFGLAMDADIVGKEKMKDNPLFNLSDGKDVLSSGTSTDISVSSSASSTKDLLKVGGEDPNKTGI